MGEFPRAASASSVSFRMVAAGVRCSSSAIFRIIARRSSSTRTPIVVTFLPMPQTLQALLLSPKRNALTLLSNVRKTTTTTTLQACGLDHREPRCAQRIAAADRCHRRAARHACGPNAQRAVGRRPRRRSNRNHHRRNRPDTGGTGDGDRRKVVSGFSRKTFVKRTRERFAERRRTRKRPALCLPRRYG